MVTETDPETIQAVAGNADPMGSVLAVYMIKRSKPHSRLSLKDGIFIVRSKLQFPLIFWQAMTQNILSLKSELIIIFQVAASAMLSHDERYIATRHYPLY